MVHKKNCIVPTRYIHTDDRQTDTHDIHTAGGGGGVSFFCVELVGGLLAGGGRRLMTAHKRRSLWIMVVMWVAIFRVGTFDLLF